MMSETEKADTTQAHSPVLFMLVVAIARLINPCNIRKGI